MKQPLRILGGVAAAVILGAGAVVATGSSNAAADDPTVKVLVGGGEPGFATNLYRAREITVLKNTTVTFDWTWLEPHTVTFGAPQGDPTQPTTGAGTTVVNYDGTGFISSGLIAGEDKRLDVRFTATGTFDYYCVIHPLMTGKVKVVDSGTVDTQASIDFRGNGEYQAALASIKQVATHLKAQPVAVTPKAGGGNKYTLIVGGIDEGGHDVQQFIPGAITIKEKDSIEWVSSIPTPHTVTFNPQAFPPGDPFEVAPVNPAGGYDGGAGLVHSGILGINWPHGLKFEVQFNKAGSYEYICLLHSDQGMVGTVNVQAQAASPTPTAPAPTPTRQAPAPPNTGTGTDGGGLGLATMLAGALAIVALAGGAMVAVRRTR